MVNEWVESTERMFPAPFPSLSAANKTSPPLVLIVLLLVFEKIDPLAISLMAAPEAVLVRLF